MSSKPLRTIFHHIVQKDAPGAPLHLKRSGYELGPVLAALEEKLDIRCKFKKIKPQEIAAAEAWLARFGADAARPAPIPADRRNAILLDECISYAILPAVTRTFGFSSHVAAEGMVMNGGNNKGKAQVMDRLIYDFAVAHNFGVLLTRDSDFTHFAKNNSAVLRDGPAILYIPPAAREPEWGLLRRQKEAVKNLIEGPGGLYHLNIGGIVPVIA